MKMGDTCQVQTSRVTVPSSKVNSHLVVSRLKGSTQLPVVPVTGPIRLAPLYLLCALLLLKQAGAG